jgi:hypothetical protein
MTRVEKRMGTAVIVIDIDVAAIDSDVQKRKKMKE